jgi:hypothetical protein
MSSDPLLDLFNHAKKAKTGSGPLGYTEEPVGQDEE